MILRVWYVILEVMEWEVCQTELNGFIMVLTVQVDGKVQERQNSIANALELHLSCTNPLKWL